MRAGGLAALSRWVRVKESAIYYEDTLNKVCQINKLVYHSTNVSNKVNKKKYCS